MPGGCSSCGKKLKRSDIIRSKKLVLGEEGLVELVYLGSEPRAFRGRETLFTYSFTPGESKLVDRRDLAALLMVENVQGVAQFRMEGHL